MEKYGFPYEMENSASVSASAAGPGGAGEAAVLNPGTQMAANQTFNVELAKMPSPPSSSGSPRRY